MVFHDDGLVAHGRHIRPARRATAHDHRDLRNALGAHIGLVVKDAAKVLFVGEHIVLVGQVGAARVHQINTGQLVLLGHLLGAQVFFHRHRVVGAALHRGVVAHHHAVHAAHPANAGNKASAGCAVAAVAVWVHGQCGQGRQLQKRRARVEQQSHPLTRRQLAPRQLLGPRRLATAQGAGLQLHTQIGHRRLHGLGIGHKVSSAGGQGRGENRHGRPSKSKRRL